jgi:hypothetical protein
MRVLLIEDDSSTAQLDFAHFLEFPFEINGLRIALGER